MEMGWEGAVSVYLSGGGVCPSPHCVLSSPGGAREVPQFSHLGVCVWWGGGDSPCLSVCPGESVSTILPLVVSGRQLFPHLGGVGDDKEGDGARRSGCGGVRMCLSWGQGGNSLSNCRLCPQQHQRCQGGGMVQFPHLEGWDSPELGDLAWGGGG